MSVSRPSTSTALTLYRCCSAQAGRVFCEKRDIQGKCCRCSDNSLRNPAFFIERPELETWGEYCDACRQSSTEELHVGPTTRGGSPSFFQTVSTQDISIHIPAVDGNNALVLFNGPDSPPQTYSRSHKAQLIAPTYSLDDTTITQNCKICLANMVNVVFFPCRHCCTCVSCAGVQMRGRHTQNSGNCPICRQKVTKWEWFYWP